MSMGLVAVRKTRDLSMGQISASEGVGGGSDPETDLQIAGSYNAPRYSKMCPAPHKF